MTISREDWRTPRGWWVAAGGAVLIALFTLAAIVFSAVTEATVTGRLADGSPYGPGLGGVVASADDESSSTEYPIAVSPSGRAVYLSSWSGIAVLDATTLRKRQTVAAYPTGTIGVLSVDANRDRLYAAGGNGGKQTGFFAAYSIARDGSLTKLFDAEMPAGFLPESSALAAAGDRIYIDSANTGTIAVSTTDGHDIGQVLGSGELATDPTTGLIYQVDLATGALNAYSRLSVGSSTLSSTESVSAAFTNIRMAVSADGRYLYTAEGLNVSVRDARSLKTIRTTSVEPPAGANDLENDIDAIVPSTTGHQIGVMVASSLITVDADSGRTITSMPIGDTTAQQAVAFHDFQHIYVSTGRLVSVSASRTDWTRNAILIAVALLLAASIVLAAVLHPRWRPVAVRMAERQRADAERRARKRRAEFADAMEASRASTPVRQPVVMQAQGAQPRTNGLAIASLIVVFFSSVVGMILGHVALSQIRQSGEGGRGLALAAVIIGWISIGLALILVLVVLALAVNRS